MIAQTKDMEKRRYIQDNTVPTFNNSLLLADPASICIPQCHTPMCIALKTINCNLHTYINTWQHCIARIFFFLVCNQNRSLRIQVIEFLTWQHHWRTAYTSVTKRWNFARLPYLPHHLAPTPTNDNCFFKSRCGLGLCKYPNASNI